MSFTEVEDLSSYKRAKLTVWIHRKKYWIQDTMGFPKGKNTNVALNKFTDYVYNNLEGKKKH